MSTTEEEKYCRDCKYIHFDFISYNWRLKTCKHPFLLTEEINLVTGDREHLIVTCNDMRYNSDECGPEGKLWEPREILYPSLPTLSSSTSVKKKQASLKLEDLM